MANNKNNPELVASHTWSRIRGGRTKVIQSLDIAAKRVGDLSMQNVQLLERYFRAVDRLELSDHLIELLPQVLVASREATGVWPRVANLKARLESEAAELDAEMGAFDDAYGWGGQA